MENKIILDKETLKKYTRSMWFVTVVILAVWVGLLVLGTFIMTWAEGITAGEGQSSYNFLIVMAFILSSFVIAVPATILLVNTLSRLVAYLNFHFAKVANGDFSTKIQTKSKNVFINEMVNNFNLMVDQLNSVAIMKNDFISTFSHEFKTPMVSIKGYAELLKDTDNLTDEQLEYVKIIINESKRLSKLSEKVMMLSKIDSQVIISDKKEFYIDGQIEECILLFDSALHEKNIELNAELKKVKILADKELVKEVWINLISNAVKYTNNGGKIDVTCFQDGDNAVITIKDNGIGMNEETLLHVFDKFYQADGPHSRGGIGLGMTLCKKITQMFGGSIVCESIENGGTTVTVTLPAIK